MKKILIVLTVSSLISSFVYAESREAEAKELLAKITEFNQAAAVKLDNAKTDKDAAEIILSSYTESNKLNIKLLDFNIKNTDYRIDADNKALEKEYVKSQNAGFDFSWAVANAQNKYKDSADVKNAIGEGYKIMFSPEYLAKLTLANMPAEKKISPVKKNYDLSTPEGQAKKLMDELVLSFETVTMRLRNSVTDKDAADSITAFNSEMNKLVAEGKALDAKYPDFSFNEKNEILKEETKRMEEAMKQFAEAMMSAALNYSDSEVFKKAIDDMSSSTEQIEEKSE